MLRVGMRIEVDEQEAQRRLASASAALKSLGVEGDRADRLTRGLEAKLRRGLEADTASRAIDDLTRHARLSRLELARMQAQTGDVGGALGTLRGGMTSATSAAINLKTALAGVGVGLAITKALDEFSELNVGLVGVQKTTGLTGRELQQLGADIQGVTKELPVTKKDLLDVAQAAGQLGVQGVDDIFAFTETIGQLGTASDLAGEQAATVLARMLNVTGEAMSEVRTLGAVLVALGNNMAATESEIAAVATQVAQATAVFGVSSAEAAALGAAMKSVGVQAELGGSAVGRAMRAIDASIRSGGESFAYLQQLTGMTGDQLKQTFQDDAVGVFQSFLDGLGRVIDKGGDVTAALEDFNLQGEEILKVLPTMAKRSDLLGQALGIAGEETKNATALTKEAIEAAKSFSAQIQIAGNYVDSIATKIGSALAPTVLGLVDDFERWVDSNDDLLTQDIPGYIEDVVEILPTLLSLLGETIKGWASLNRVVGAGIEEWRAAWELAEQKHFSELRAEAVKYRDDMERLFGEAIKPQWATIGIDEDILEGMEKLVKLEEDGRSASGERAQRMVREYQSLKRIMRELIEERRAILDESELKHETEQAIKLYGDVEDAISRMMSGGSARPRRSSSTISETTQEAKEQQRLREQLLKDYKQATLDKYDYARWLADQELAEAKRVAKGQSDLLEMARKVYEEKYKSIHADEVEYYSKSYESWGDLVSRKMQLEQQAYERQQQESAKWREKALEIDQSSLDAKIVLLEEEYQHVRLYAENKEQATRDYEERKLEIVREFAEREAEERIAQADSFGEYLGERLSFELGLHEDAQQQQQEEWRGYYDAIEGFAEDYFQEIGDFFEDWLDDGEASFSDFAKSLQKITRTLVTDLMYEWAKAQFKAAFSVGGSVSGQPSGGYQGAQAASAGGYAAPATMTDPVTGEVLTAPQGSAGYGDLLSSAGGALSGSGGGGSLVSGTAIGDWLGSTSLSESLGIYTPTTGYTQFTSGSMPAGYASSGYGITNMQYLGSALSAFSSIMSFANGDTFGGIYDGITALVNLIPGYGQIISGIMAILKPLVQSLTSNLFSDHHQGTESVLIGKTVWGWGDTDFDTSLGSDQVEWVSGATQDQAEMITDYLSKVAEATYEQVENEIKGLPSQLEDYVKEGLEKQVISFGRHGGWGDLGDFDFEEEDLQKQLEKAGADLADRILGAASEGMAYGFYKAFNTGEMAKQFDVVSAEWDSLTTSGANILDSSKYYDFLGKFDSSQYDSGEEAYEAMKEWYENLQKANSLFAQVEGILGTEDFRFTSGFDTAMMGLENAFDDLIDQMEELGFAEEYIAKIEAQRADYLAEQAERLKTEARDSIEQRWMALNGQTDELQLKALANSQKSELLSMLDTWVGTQFSQTESVNSYFEKLLSGDAEGAAAIFDSLEASLAGMGEGGQIVLDFLKLLRAEFAQTVEDMEEAWRKAGQQLDLRLLQATGQDWQAQQMAFAIQQQEEYAAAVDSGADAAYLAKLAFVQLAEAEAFFAAHAAAVADFNNDLRVRLLQINGQSLDAQLLAFDLSAAKQRAEAEALGADMALFEEVLAKERLAIVEDYNQQIVDAYEEAFATIRDFVNDIQEYLNGLLLSDKTTLNPYEQLTQAGEAYESVIATINQYKGRTDLTNDERDALYYAMQQVTGVADAYLEQARGYYASSPAYQAIFDDVVATLGDLPDMLTPEQFIAEEIRAMSAAVTSSVDAVDSSVNEQGGAIVAELSDYAISALGHLSEIDADGDKTLSKSEWDAYFGTNGTATAVFQNLDADGDGKLSIMEIVDGVDVNQLDPYTPASYAYKSLVNLQNIDADGDKFLSKSEWDAYFGTSGTATAAFQKLDADGDGKLSIMEIAQGVNVVGMSSVATNTGNIDSNTDPASGESSTIAGRLFGIAEAVRMGNTIGNNETYQTVVSIWTLQAINDNIMRMGESLDDIAGASNFVGLPFSHYWDTKQSSAAEQEESPGAALTTLNDRSGSYNYLNVEDTRRLFEPRSYAQAQNVQLDTRDLVGAVKSAIVELAMGDAQASGERRQMISLLRGQLVEARQTRLSGERR